MSAEWFVPDTAIPVRQGDVLISRNVLSGKINEICTVITADCDISKGKFGKQIACLRVTRLHQYLCEVWAEKKFKKAKDVQVGMVRDQMAKWQAVQTGEPSGLTVESALNWILRSSAEDICAILKVPDEKKKGIEKSIYLLKTALLAVETHTDRDFMSKWATFKACVGEKETGVCQQEILDAAQKDNLPEDVFLLTSLPQIDVGPVVVMLREVVGIQAESIRYRAAEADTENLFLRVGRLEPTFKYAVSQAFGSLYSRIGLPDEYEKRRASAIQNIHTYKWEK